MMDRETQAAAAQARIRFLVRPADDPLAQDGPNVRRDLLRSPKRISPVYIYDRVGTELFERQCLTSEYYLRRAEAALLSAHAAEIVELCGCVPIVELGAGTAEKTRLLLTQYLARDWACDYFPIDVDAATLQNSAVRLVATYPRLSVYCLGTTYAEGLRALPPSQRPRLHLYLGSSLGNMELGDMDRLLADLKRAMSHGSHLLIGADLDKDPAVIERAYNDSAGFGARSTLNMLAHLNRRYDGDFVLDRFEYRSRYNALDKRNEVHIVSLVDQWVTFGALGCRVAFAAGELIEAEIMWKFDPDALQARLAQAGFARVKQWIDPRDRYGLFLFRR